MKKGMALTVTRAMVVLPTPQPMKRQVPTGGVQRPMQRLAIMMMPKCRGVMPTTAGSMTTGSRMGVKIRMAGVMSMKKPTTSRSRLMMSRMPTGPTSRLVRKPETVAGMLAIVRIQLMALEEPTRSMTTAVVTPVCRQRSGRSRRGISR